MPSFFDGYQRIRGLFDCRSQFRNSKPTRQNKNIQCIQHSPPLQPLGFVLFVIRGIEKLGVGSLLSHFDSRSRALSLLSSELFDDVVLLAFFFHGQRSPPQHIVLLVPAAAALAPSCPHLPPPFVHLGAKVFSTLIYRKKHAAIGWLGKPDE